MFALHTSHNGLGLSGNQNDLGCLIQRPIFAKCICFLFFLNLVKSHREVNKF